MKRFLLMLLFAAEFASAKHVMDIAVYTYSESVGRHHLKYNNDGYQKWLEAGWDEYFSKYLNKDPEFLRRNGLRPCTSNDKSLYTYTPCMAASMVHAMERSVEELGVNIDFKVTRHLLSNQIDLNCKKQCVYSAVDKWGDRVTSDIDVLVIPVHGGGAHGTTRFSLRNGRSQTKMAVVGGGQQPYSILHLFRHEMGHALGFYGHLYDGKDFILNKGKKRYPSCPEIPVKIYKNSGLKRDCANRTFLGHWYPQGKSCGNRSMGNSGFFNVKWNVPMYGPIFRRVFTCHLDKFGRKVGQPQPNPDPKPEPKPDPKPEPKPLPPKNQHKYCPNWIDLIKRYNCE